MMSKLIYKLPSIFASSVKVKVSNSGTRSIFLSSIKSTASKRWRPQNEKLAPISIKTSQLAPISGGPLLPPRYYVTQNPAPKKRILKRKSIDEVNTFPVVAYATCDEYDLEEMHKGLIAQDLYIPSRLSDDLESVIHTTAKYKIGPEPREIFFFREGAVVFWNMPELERNSVLKFLKTYEEESYDVTAVMKEYEYMVYAYQEQGNTRLYKNKMLFNQESENNILEKYAFANALALSVKLGIWESTLENFVDGIEHITSELKRAEHIKLTRAEVLQKTGELFALRHQLNLNSDLLDTPDFYWERERLETLYQKTRNHLSISRRTTVMNEKLTQCCELLDLISNHLTDQHHTRLEWMIIVLIMIEVCFEILHVVERYGFV